MSKNVNKKLTDQQKAYARKKRKKQELQKCSDEASVNAAKLWRDQNPDCADLHIKPLNIAYIRKPGNKSKVIHTLAEQMTWPRKAGESQVKMLNDIRASFPNMDLHPSIWQKPLSKRDIDRVATIVNGNIPAPINLKGCTTLSQFRKKMLAAKRVASNSRTFNVSITVTREAILFNDMSYALERKVSGGYKYPLIRVPLKGRRQSLRIDVLGEILKQSEK